MIDRDRQNNIKKSLFFFPSNTGVIVLLTHAKCYLFLFTFARKMVFLLGQNLNERTKISEIPILTKWPCLTVTTVFGTLCIALRVWRSMIDLDRQMITYKETECFLCSNTNLIYNKHKYMYRWWQIFWFPWIIIIAQFTHFPSLGLSLETFCSL